MSLTSFPSFPSSQQTSPSLEASAPYKQTTPILGDLATTNFLRIGGHGISGMSMLSISSFISVAAMFAGGMGLAAIL